MHGRFYLLQMLDGWTEVSDQSPGSRAGSAEGDYVLVGPDCGKYKQPLIPGNGFAGVIRMPTSNMWIICRIYTDGSDADIADVVNNIYPGLTLTPWSKFTPGGTYTPPDHLSTQAFGDVTTAPVRQLNGMDACAFFGNLASMLAYNPPVPGQDDAAVRSLAHIGVVPGQPFDCTTLRAEWLANLQQALDLGKNVLENVPATRPTSTNWTVSAPCLNNDKSLDIYLQSTAPTDAKQKCHWIPTPTSGNFIAFLRLYWPDQVVLDKGWIPPAIEINR